MKTKLIGIMAALLGLCFGLTGCEDLSSSMANTVAGQSGQRYAQGTVTAVNAADRTIEVKTDNGKTMMLAVADASKLVQSVGAGLWQHDNAITLDAIAVGKYLEFNCSKEPVDGKYTAVYVEQYNSRWDAD